MLAEILVEAQKLVEQNGGQQEWHGEAGGIDGEQQNTTLYCLACRGEDEDGGKDGADAGSPAEGEGESEENAAEDSGFAIFAVQADVLIQPSREHRPEEADDGEREEVRCAQTGEQWAAVNQRGNS